MTVSSIIPVNNYTGNSSNKIFDFDFLIEDETELVVQHANEKGIISTLKCGVDYSIAEVGNKNGSYITFPLEDSTFSILGNEEKLSLALSLTIKQESEFHNSSYFNLNVLEWTFDYIVRILQILNRKIDRCVKVEEFEDITPNEMIKNINDINKDVSLSHSQILELANGVSKNADIVESLKTETKECTDIVIQKTKEMGKIIGEQIAVFCSPSYVPEGTLPCDGAEYTKAQFSDLWVNYIETAYLNTCTYAEYETEITTYGQCSKFAVDTDNLTFKVPTITKIISDVADTLGVRGNGTTLGLTDGTNYGGLKMRNTTDYKYLTSSPDLYGSVVGTSVTTSTNFIQNAGIGLTTEPENSGVVTDVDKTYLELRYFVVVANGQTNQSMMDWSAWASSLQGKLNADHSNDTKPYVVETSDKSILPSWYRVWSDGWCEQGGLAVGGSTTAGATVVLIYPYKDENYTLVSSINSTSFSNTTVMWAKVGNKTASSFSLQTGHNVSTGGEYSCSWESKGYILTDNFSGDASLPI